MRTAILVVGPQSSGKSTFAGEVVKKHPDIALVSRDIIFTDHFSLGDDDQCLSDFDSRHPAIFAKMWEQVSKHSQQSQNSHLILDCWSRNAEDRCAITSNLRSLGADRIGAWHFKTPVDKCLSWLAKRHQDAWKDPVMELALQHVRYWQHVQFCQHKVDHSQGFDFIVPIELNESVSFSTLFQNETPLS